MITCKTFPRAARGRLAGAGNALLLPLLLLGSLGLLGGAGSAALAQPTPGDMDGLGERVPHGLKVYVEGALPEGRAQAVWVPSGSLATSALARVPRFPGGGDGIEPLAAGDTLALRGVRNEQVSAQLAVLHAGARRLELRAQAGRLQGPGGAAIPAGQVQARYVGYVPVERALSERTWSARLGEVAGRAVSGTRAPDVVADPIAALPFVEVPPYRAQPVWLTVVQIPEGVPPGTYEGRVTLRLEARAPLRWPLRLRVAGAPALPDPPAYRFHLDVWMNPGAVAAWYDVEPWSGAHWRLLRAYLRDRASRGQKRITTTIVENPWPVEGLGGARRAQTATPYPALVRWTRQAGGTWRFDYRRFDRYVRAALAAGVGPAINAFSMLSFRGPQRLVYRDAATGEKRTETVEIGGARWRRAWTAFLESFSAHLRERGWLGQTWLAYDERPPALMEQALGLVEEVAPALAERIVVAGTPEVSLFADDLALPYAALPAPGRAADSSRHADSSHAGSSQADTLALARARRRAGRATRFYTAGQPAHPNTFAFSPAVEARMLPWIALGHGLDGYLRWAYNDWPRAVFRHPVFRYVQGDEYLVYPGAEGPMTSIRWELLKKGIEDFELAVMLRARGRLGPEAFAEAIRQATRTPDGRAKALADFRRARALLLGAP